MLAAIGGRFVVLDHVSEVEAFAALHGPLVQGYALDALEAPEEQRRHRSKTLESSSSCCSAPPCTPGRAVGLGEGLRFAFGGLAGTGLVCEGELVTLTAFADEPGRTARLWPAVSAVPPAAVRGRRAVRDARLGIGAAMKGVEVLTVINAARGTLGLGPLPGLVLNSCEHDNRVGCLACAIEAAMGCELDLNLEAARYELRYADPEQAGHVAEAIGGEFEESGGIAVLEAIDSLLTADGFGLTFLDRDGCLKGWIEPTDEDQTRMGSAPDAWARLPTR